MALVKNKVGINFSGGVDTKTDDKLVVPGKLLELKNGVFTKIGSINKRNGYTVLPKYTLSGSVITQGSALGSFNNELNLYTGKELLSYSSSTENWIPKGPVVSLVAKSVPIIRNTAVQTHPVSAFNAGFTVHAWQNSANGVSYSLRDESTGMLVVQNSSLGGGEARSKPKIVALGSNFIVIFTYNSTSTSLKYDVISIANPGVITTSGIVTGNMDATTSTYDVCTVGDRVFIAFDASDTWYYFCYLSLSLTVSVPAQFAVGALPCYGMNVVGDDSQRVWIFYSTGAHLRAMAFSYSLVPILTTTIIDGSLAQFRNITAQVIDDVAHVYYEYPAAATHNTYVKTNTISLAGTVGIGTVFLRSVGLAAKAFLYDSEIYVPLVHDSALQSGYFIASSQKNVVAKVAYQNGGTLITGGSLGSVSKLSSSTYLFSSQIKGKLDSEGGVLSTTLGVNSTILDFTSEYRFQNSQMGELYIAGGSMSSYDGIKVVECGFNLYPENVEATVATTGGLLSTGTYQYVVAYEWTDNLGQIHRSAPSIPTTVVTSTGTSKVTLTIPNLRLTQKDDVRIVVYRTLVNGTVFYRVSSLASPLINSINTDTTTFEDVISDTVAQGNDYIYTTGAVLENISTPACSLITTFKNRVVIAGLENPLSFWYSKYKTPGVGIEFTDFFQKEVDARGGKITALGVIDNALILFKENSIYASSGDGPNDLGLGDDFTVPSLITSDVGCSNPNSIVTTPNGLMFQTSKGIYLLTRSLESVYIGQAVESFNSLLITSSQLINNKNQVRFTTSEDLCLVYDYFSGQWSTFTNHTAEDSALFNGEFAFIKSDGSVWLETPGQFKDDTLFISMSLTTSWLSLDIVQGFERVYRLSILGDYKSPHNLEVGVGYDFNSIFTQSSLIDVDAKLGVQAFGEAEFYGSGVYGGEFPLYQFDAHLTTQKCQSIRFRFRDIQTSEAGEAYSIASLALEVGVKAGLGKAKKAKSFKMSR